MKLGYWPKFQKVYMHLFSTQGGRNWAYFRSMAALSEIWTDVQNCRIWSWNLAIGQSSTYTLFLPQGIKIELIFTLRAAVSKILAHFQNCHIWAWKFAIGQSSRICTYTLFLPQGSKLSLFSLYRLRFPRYGPLFKIATFGHENLAIGKIVPEVAHVLSLYPRGSKLSLFHSTMSTGSSFWDTGWFSKLPFWAWNLAIGRVPKFAYILFLPKWVEIGLIFTLQAAVSKIRANFQNSHIWA